MDLIALAVVVPCLILWSSLYAYAVLAEVRPLARPFELLRLLVIVPIGTFTIVQQGFLSADLAWTAVPLYCGLSLAAFLLTTGSRDNLVYK